MQWLSRILGSAPAAQMPIIQPGSAFYAIGDIHGRVDLLQRLLDKLDADIPVICVGDYVDRGEDSAAVLRLLQTRDDITCLIGNHEQMLLDFLDHPSESGARWLRFGGLQTLASFGVAGIFQTTDGVALNAARDALTEVMGPALIQWLRCLPASHISGNVAVVHAGANPAEPIATQSVSTLIWGHPDFNKMQRTDGVWVVHGHTIVDQPDIADGRIAIDTGAYATGRLTAALVRPDDISFITA